MRPIKNTFKNPLNVGEKIRIISGFYKGDRKVIALMSCKNNYECLKTCPMTGQWIVLEQLPNDHWEDPHWSGEPKGITFCITCLSRWEKINETSI